MRKTALFIAGLAAGVCLSLFVNPSFPGLGPAVSRAQRTPTVPGWDYLIWEHKPIRRHPDLVAAEYDSLGAEGWQLVQVMQEVDQSVFVRMQPR